MIILRIVDLWKSFRLFARKEKIEPTFTTFMDWLAYEVYDRDKNK